MTADRAQMEAEVAVLLAQLRASSFNRQQKEPADTPYAMVPVAYAMLQFLLESADGSGLERFWRDFLANAYEECVNHAVELR